MKKQPNILLIMSDQHSPHLLGCAGNSIVRTPHLDALASRGVRFSSTYCASPLCVPSRAAFLTGRYPNDIGVWTNPSLLDPDTPTFAHALTLAGYETVLCGRMHFGGADQHHGFSRRLVGDVSGARDESQPLFENIIPQHTTGQDWLSVRDAGPGQSTYMAFDRDVTKRACAFLRDKQHQDAQIDDAKNAKPWCMVAGYLLPHNPYICPKELFDEYMDSIDVPETPAAELDSLHPAMRQWRNVRGVEQLAPEHIRRARAAYFGLTTYLDQQIGRVLGALDESGLSDDTVVIYVSDHGEMAGEHGLWWKDSFYEGAVGVPMIWSRPGRFAAGATVDAVTSLVDIAPTLIDIAGAQALPGPRGHSLLEMLTSGLPVDGWPDQALAEIYPRGLWPARMIRRGQWKLNYFHGFDRPQLFDLSSDPGERHDLGNSAAHIAIRKELMNDILDGWDAKRIIEETAYKEQAFHLMQNYYSAANTGESDQWRIPEGSNHWISCDE